ncbi:MAG: LamB/YcsF family protein [Gemmiger sp.]
MPSVDLNCDLGESFGAYTLGMDTAVLPLVSSANVACGFHAGDPQVMRRTVALCRENGTAVGAHPGLPDLQGFGRRVMKLTPAEAADCVTYQIGALKAFCDAAGVPLHHVKLHGALYNMAARDPALADAIAAAVQAAAPGAVLLALSGSEMVRAARAIGLPVASEVFADRAYRSDGTLVPRGMPGAMIEDEALAIRRVVRMVKESRVTAIDGTDILLQADSICVHGDGPQALTFARRIREALCAENIPVRAF